jgi:hypothetical protein
MTEPEDGRDREPRKGTNVLALVAGALIALLAVLAFLALISKRSGAQEYHASPPVVQETVIVPAVAS